jgi:5-methylcytosine-specific restriction endonuclease McrA
MHALTVIAGIGAATRCEVDCEHRPTPRRHVWHHILPLVCGGRTERLNLAELCDNCHAAVHRLMYQLAGGQRLDERINPDQRALAEVGYQRAKASGTVNLIPNE